ncbi:SRPBCC domain-containing protein [Novosphingobium sp. JCM 18896]|uniref:SRPBCC domain-containing protein n=1 Tax=Novosphingobium sp. JCM 18896 TaxID=2989731 RepID=UPI00222368D8|nr:SRPBCC domain-containing protein [Novosphingobium sp. JCM 18896]MCW1429007.1 SRPBCC domain-containing protein [Novosphingobium sp. JCM 18896]
MTAYDDNDYGYEDEHRVDRAYRIIAAPVAVVYAALTDARMVANWLPPEGATGTMEAFDPQPGGAIRMTLRFASGEGGKTTADTDVVSGRFVELDPNECVVQEFDFVSDDPAFAGTMRMTWGLTWCAEGTEISVVAENVPSGISKEDHAVGLASSLANLAAYIEQ